MVRWPADWPWFCYRAHVGLADGTGWLDNAALHAYLLGQAANTPDCAARAMRGYAQWVAAGLDVRLWDDALNHQVFLGDEAFVARMQALLAPSSLMAAAH